MKQKPNKLLLEKQIRNKELLFQKQLRNEVSV